MVGDALRPGAKGRQPSRTAVVGGFMTGPSMQVRMEGATCSETG